MIHIGLLIIAGILLVWQFIARRMDQADHESELRFAMQRMAYLEDQQTDYRRYIDEATEEITRQWQRGDGYKAAFHRAMALVAERDDLVRNTRAMLKAATLDATELPGGGYDDDTAIFDGGNPIGEVYCADIGDFD